MTRTKNCPTTPGTRRVVLVLHQNNISLREIQRQTNVHPSTASRIISRFKERGHHENLPRKGRSLILTRRDKRHILRIMLDNRFQTLEEIIEHSGVNCSTDTVQRFLKAEGYNQRIAR